MTIHNKKLHLHVICVIGNKPEIIMVDIKEICPELTPEQEKTMPGSFIWWIQEKDITEPSEITETTEFTQVQKPQSIEEFAELIDNLNVQKEVGSTLVIVTNEESIEPVMEKLADMIPNSVYATREIIGDITESEPATTGDC